MFPKIQLDSDFFGLDAINQGLVQYHKQTGGKTPTKIIFAREEWRDIRTLAHTGRDGHDWGKRATDSGILEIGNLRISIEKGEAFEII